MAKQPEAKVKFSVFNKEFNEGLQEMSRESTRLRKEFNLQSAQMKDTATATEKLEAKIEHLGKQKGITQRKIEATTQQLEKAKKVYGENSNEAHRLGNDLLDLQIKEQKLENSIRYANNQIDKQGQEMQEASKDVDRFGDKLQDLGDKASRVGDKLTLGVTTPLTALGGIAGKSAIDLDSATRLMIGTLGATGAEAERLEEDLKSLWSDGFGENPEEIARSLLLVKQNIQGINDGEELQNITKNMLLLADATESDMSEATRGMNQLMHNFGVTAEEALDLFVRGNQEGINYSNEMFDNVAEYAPLFKNMGFTAEEYFTILANGAQNGAYNLDYVNDIMKEMEIRLQDGSDKTADAIASLSKETQDLFKEFLKGEATAEDMFRAIIPDLEEMEDQVVANQLGVELFGTKFEDMGATTVYALDDMNDAFEDTEGAMNDFAKVQEEAFGHKAKRTLRELLQALEPVGQELLELGERAIPVVQDFSKWISELDDETKEFLMTLGGMGLVAGPAIKTVGGLSTSVGKLSSLFRKADDVAGTKKGFGKTLLSLAGRAGPIGLGIAGFGLLATGIKALTSDTEELNDVSLDRYHALTQEHQANEQLIEQYDALREKSKLSNNEFARYVDLQTELQNATNPDIIEDIKNEMNGLQQQSGLSNEELSTMVGLNNDLVKALPGATEEITEQGNKIAGTTDSMRKYNEEIERMATVELESQFFNSLENQATHMDDMKEAQAELNRLKEQEVKIEELRTNYTDDQLADQKEILESEVKKYRHLLENTTLNAEMTEHYMEQLQTSEMNLALIEDGKKGLTEHLKTNQQNQVEQQGIISNNENLINQNEQIANELLEQYLTQGGISEEQARQAIQNGEASKVLQKHIEYLEQQKIEAANLHRQGKKTTEEYNEQVSTIDKQIGRLQQADANIHNMIDSAEAYNTEMAKELRKKVGVTVDPTVETINLELGKDVKKYVRVYTSTDGQYARLADPVTKRVTIRSSGGGRILEHAQGTKFHPGGPAILAEEGPEIVKERNRTWLATNIGVYNPERGAKVFTAEETNRILRGLKNLPAYASGTVGTIANDNRVTLPNSILNNNVTFKLESSDVVLDGQKVGQIIWKPVKDSIEQDNIKHARAKGYVL